MSDKKKINQGNMADQFRLLEGDLEYQREINSCPRKVYDLSGYTWFMEGMRPGQGIAEGIPLLVSEQCGNTTRWNSATIPGDVYTDLQRAGEIEDPYFGRNFAKCKWVQDYEFWYTNCFNMLPEMEGKNITLEFEGVDYSFDVWINTIHVGHHDGMMSSFKVDITDLVEWDMPRAPINRIMIKLDPAPKNQRDFAGMKQYFSGDYLAGISTAGIWKPIKLIATDKVRIENYRVETKLNDNVAEVSVDFEILGLGESLIDGVVKVALTDDFGNSFIKEVDVKMEKGINEGTTAFSIEDPNLWWPYELGSSYQYNIDISVWEDETPLDEITEKVGLREITMKMNPGFTEEEAESPWTFVVNGKPMFLRSACWGGQPSFLYGRNSEKKYRYFLEAAKECGINNLRIFGWHPVETKEFYDICDELGITVWTNFGFATMVFRDDEEYLNKLYTEITEIVKNTRNHASTIMWMGGEEVFFSERHVKSNNKVLMQKLGEITKSLTNVPYSDGSPLSSREGIRMGYKPKESFHANSHCYAAGLVFMEDYYPYLDYCIIPELTAYSAPSIKSLKKFIPEDEMWPAGMSWGYHGAVLHNLEIFNFEVFGKTCMNTVEEFAEATQVAQGTIFQYSLEHFRRNKPHVSGVSLCHFITPWPLVKWEIIDYYGEKKQSYDFVRKSYQILLPSMQFRKRRYMPGEEFIGKIWIVNDYYKAYDNLTLQCTIYDSKGNEQKLHSEVINVGINSSKEYFEMSWVVEGEFADTFSVELQLLDETHTLIADNKYMILIRDQEADYKVAKEMNYKMNLAKTKYGQRGYYRYTPDLIEYE